MQEVLKGLGNDTRPPQDFEERIAELELFTKKLKNKKAFKKL